MRGIDKFLVIAGTMVVGVLWMAGVGQTSEEPSRAPAGIMENAMVSPWSPDYDPAKALGLPEGVTIDPETGFLTGIDLEGDKDTKPLPWELLRTYEYQPGLAGMPEDIKKLDGQKVVMLGFLMATFEYDDIHEFHLVASHWSCCYGIPPGLDGAVHVKLPDEAEGLPSTLRPIKVVGTLKVGEVKESGVVYAIYAMHDAEATILDF